jgi:4-hydroxymandelate oxidase
VIDFLNLREVESLARETLSAEVFDYYAGGANDEVSLRANRREYDGIALRPRVMVDVSARSMETELVGVRTAAPIVIAPMAFQRLAHPEGELAVARAAASAGLVMTASTYATCCLEDIAGSCEGAKWFQLYVHKDRETSRDLVQRAEAAGFKALVLTADLPELGRRERDERNGFGLPGELRVANFRDGDVASDDGSGLRKYIAGIRDPSLSWKDLEWLCSLSKMPVIVKGLVRGDDAVKAIEHGASGVVVSNHGGRQLDTCIAPIRALPEVADAVQGRIPVLVDGGIRRGTDVVKALALGACAVMLGRPVLWGLTVGGQAGVERVLALLMAEFDLAMALCGARSVGDLTRDLCE